jgi:AbiV family abortive infection protein
VRTAKPDLLPTPESCLSGARAAAANSQRLLLSAGVLQRRHRHGPAAALYATALEEAIKAISLLLLARRDAASADRHLLEKLAASLERHDERYALTVPFSMLVHPGAAFMGLLLLALRSYADGKSSPEPVVDLLTEAAKSPPPRRSRGGFFASAACTSIGVTDGGRIRSTLARRRSRLSVTSHACMSLARAGSPDSQQHSWFPSAARLALRQVPIARPRRQRVLRRPCMTVRTFRVRLAKLAAIAAMGSFGGVVVGVLPAPAIAAYGWVAAGSSTAVLIGSLMAMWFAGSYKADRSDVAGKLGALARYVARAGAWGLAGGGVGALLAQTLPTRLTEPASTNPDAVPMAGWLAIAGGALGVAFGLLEEWHQQSSTEPSASPDERESSDKNPTSDRNRR